MIANEVVQSATQAFAGKLCEDREKGITQHHKAMRVALEAIEPMLRDMPDGWIPIDTWPSEWGSFLTWSGALGMRILQFQPLDGGTDGKKAGNWYDDEDLCCKISHWMPLPAGPKPTRDGE
jgi:hypothetical protein